MNTYCLVCKKYTGNINPKVIKTKNNINPKVIKTKNNRKMML